VRRAQTAGRTVGITGPSHAVICHLIDTVYEHARRRGAGPPRIGQRADRDHPYLHADATRMHHDTLERALRDGELDVAAGTSWLWARGPFADSVDTLFVDEAGQMSLAGVLAVAGAARNLVLLGDPRWSSTRWRPLRPTKRPVGWTSSTTCTA